MLFAKGEGYIVIITMYPSPLAKSIVTYYRNISRIKKPIKFILSHAHHAHVLLFMPIILTPLIPSQSSIEPQVTVHFSFLVLWTSYW